MIIPFYPGQCNEEYDLLGFLGYFGFPTAAKLCLEISESRRVGRMATVSLMKTADNKRRKDINSYR